MDQQNKSLVAHFKKLQKAAQTNKERALWFMNNDKFLEPIANLLLYRALQDKIVTKNSLLTI